MKKILLFTSIALLFSACTYKQVEHGKILYPQDIKEIEYGKTTMLELMKIIGTPSLELDDGSWLYISSSGYTTHSGEYMHNKKCTKFTFKDGIVVDKSEIALDDFEALTNSNTADLCEFCKKSAQDSSNSSQNKEKPNFSIQDYKKHPKQLCQCKHKPANVSKFKASTTTLTQSKLECDLGNGVCVLIK